MMVYGCNGKAMGVAEFTQVCNNLRLMSGRTIDEVEGVMYLADNDIRFATWILMDYERNMQLAAGHVPA